MWRWQPTKIPDDLKQNLDERGSERYRSYVTTMYVSTAYSVSESRLVSLNLFASFSKGPGVDGRIPSALFNKRKE